MNRVLVAGLLISSTIAAVAFAAGAPVAPNGIALLEGYRDWQVVSPSYRPDKGHIRLILGNPVAVAALRDGKRPFPDGAIFAKIAWNAAKLAKFPVAEVPASFAQVEFMIKDSGKYKNTGGWGFARFVGESYKPYGKDEGFVQECFGCHTPVADNDYVFTHWAGLPDPPKHAEEGGKTHTPYAH
jgi:hypothetical protein